MPADKNRVRLRIPLLLSLALAVALAVALALAAGCSGTSSEVASNEEASTVALAEPTAAPEPSSTAAPSPTAPSPTAAAPSSTATPAATAAPSPTVAAPAPSEDPLSGETVPVPAGSEIALVSALISDTARTTPPDTRASKSGLYDHSGQNPAEDCAGLLRGQAHTQLREASVSFRWYEPEAGLDQRVAQYGDANSAATHMDQFAQFGNECDNQVFHCRDCGFLDGSFDRTFQVTSHDTGVPGAIALRLHQVEDDITEWRALYRREAVVTMLSMTRGPTKEPGTQAEDLLAFDQTVALMADSLDQASLRPIAGPWPDPYMLGDFEIELVAVHVDIDTIDGIAWVDYRESEDSSRVFASFDETGAMTGSVSIFMDADPHDPEDVDYTLSDYSFFDNETTVAGRLAISMPWFDEEMEESLGNLLVWDASPQAYGWMQSRSLTLTEMRDIAAVLAVNGTNFEWPPPTAGMQQVAQDIFASEAEDFLRSYDQSATFTVEWEIDDYSERAEISVAFFASLDGDIDVLRSVAFGEESASVRGTTGYQLLIAPVSEHDDGQVYVVWQEDETTTGIATVDDLRAASLLAEVANQFNRDRTYD